MLLMDVSLIVAEQRFLLSRNTVRPSAPLRYSRLAVFLRLCFSLNIEALVPAVPRKSLCPTHAPSAPVAACPVIRNLADSSQWRFPPLVLTTPSFLTTRLQWVHFRSSFGHAPAQGFALSFCSNANHRDS